MPAWVKDEEKWGKAKKIVQKQYDLNEKDGEDFWKLVTEVYKKMGGEIRKGDSVKESILTSKSLIFRIDEIGMIFDMNKMSNAAQARGLSLQDFLEKEYNLKQNHYDVKAKGLDIARSALRNKKSRVNKLMIDFDGKFSTSAGEKYLVPDPDGTSIKNAAGQSVPVASPKPPAPPKAKVTASPPAPATVSAGAKKLPDKQVFKVWGNTLTVTFTAYNDKSDSYGFEVSGGDTKINGSVLAANYDIADAKGKRKLLADDIYFKLPTMFKKCNLNGSVGIRGIDFNYSLKLQDFLEEKSVCRVLYTDTKGAKKEFKIAIKEIRDSEMNVVNAIEDYFSKHEKESPFGSTLTVGPNSIKIVKGSPQKKVSLYRKMAEYLFKKAFSDKDDISLVLVVSGRNKILSLLVTVTSTDPKFYNLRGDDLNNAISDYNSYVEQCFRKTKARQFRVVDKGLDDSRQVFVQVEVYDNNLIQELVKEFKLDETFGYSAFEPLYDNYNYILETVNERFGEIVYNTLFSGIKEMDIFECFYNKYKGTCTCYFALRPDISEERVDEIRNLYGGVVMIYDDNAGNYLGIYEVKDRFKTGMLKRIYDKIN